MVFSHLSINPIPRSDWCVVIVGDKELPKSFHILTNSDNAANLVYLDADAQRSMDSEFVNALPWRSFGRKNVGYLYAIAQGARVIWDFDDDNMLKFWLKGASNPDWNLELDQFAAYGTGMIMN